MKRKLVSTSTIPLCHRLSAIYSVYRVRGISQCMWLDFSQLRLTNKSPHKKLEITNTRIDSFYGSIKLRFFHQASLFCLHNVEESCFRLFGSYFKICMRRLSRDGSAKKRKRKEKAWRKIWDENLCSCGGVAKQQCFFAPFWICFFFCSSFAIRDIASTHLVSEWC